MRIGQWIHPTLRDRLRLSKLLKADLRMSLSLIVSSLAVTLPSEREYVTNNNEYFTLCKTMNAKPFHKYYFESRLLDDKGLLKARVKIISGATHL